MTRVVLIVLGLLIFGLTFAGWVWLNAFACGMSPNGCGGFTLHWGDWEALRIFVPGFVIGAGLCICGILARR